MRTIVDIPSDDIRALDALSKREHVSRTEMVRRAVEAYLRTHNLADPKAAFGMWKKKPKNAIEYQRRLRREWERP